ncbi:DUF5694 domain-containing protein [Sphingorhabdus sp. YGSMI21]|uniref:DUF5694 domain-containing protein n=1 Tax=Sphingorhabdus sp. YGSMI21 TaxID=2077182 RepID=UPI000C1E8C51|nr:DUF5694 domain-containing protein [Sphingorhabdus sp. YGSMI21]ATW03611.1 hypothetical protein CHN51_08745 [Sphingorhabdus sp. YGSMI21]
MKALFATLLALCFAAQPALAADTTGQAPEPVRVMVLGVYHFANPGADLNNAKVDDVLTPQRQKELEALAETLKTFQPTVVAVEASAEPPYADTGYSGFKPEDLTKERNEVVQMGYRVAHAAGIERVYAIDEQPSEGEPDYFPYGSVQQQAEETGEAERLKIMSDFGAMMARFEEEQKSKSIPELLMFWNGDTLPDDFYWNIMTIGQGEKQTGAELAAYWFMRNAKIFNKLVQVTQPGDRVILIFGSGHRAWLREMVEKTQGYELEPVMPYLQQAAGALSE